MRELLDLVKISPKVCGIKRVLESIINDTAGCVIVSNDSESFIMETIKEACEGKQVELIQSCKGKELGKACGIQVATATVAILKTSEL